MAILHMCDKCGKRQERDGELLELVVPHSSSASQRSRYDFCQACLKEIHLGIRKSINRGTLDIDSTIGWR